MQKRQSCVKKQNASLPFKLLAAPNGLRCKSCLIAFYCTLLKQSAIAVCVGLMVCEWANVVKGLLLAILHNTNYRTNSKFRPLTGSLPASNPATLRFVGVIAGFVL